MRKLVIACMLASTLAVGSAEAMVQRYCMQPNPPTAFLSRPSRPFCATTGRCSDFEISSYRSEVERYFRRLRQYASDVDTYYEEASTYIRCMSNLD